MSSITFISLLQGMAAAAILLVLPLSSSGEAPAPAGELDTRLGEPVIVATSARGEKRWGFPPVPAAEPMITCLPLK